MKYDPDQPYQPWRKDTIRHRFLVWLFPDLAIEVRVFADAFHGCMVKKRELEAAAAERRDQMDEGRIRRVDCAIARQLQASIERNSRMVGRLKKLQSECNDFEPRKCVIDDIDAILRDEDF